jgi:predicted MFS family arabinose efflux permease
VTASVSPVSAPTPLPAVDRAFAVLLGLHGLALLVVFPFGPQVTRLWHPGVAGIGALAAAFPLAAVIGGLIARQVPRLPSSPAALGALAFFTTLPSALASDYPMLVAARALAGLAAGLSFVAIHRVLRPGASALLARISPRIVAFGMPLCLLAATALDLRFAFAPILAAQAILLLWTNHPVDLAPGRDSLANPRSSRPSPETAPFALGATGALAFVSSACLTVLSGFLVFNAGHTEWHIPLILLLAALLGLGTPPLVHSLASRVGPAPAYLAALLASSGSLAALHVLRGPATAAVAVGAIALFLVLSPARHLALARLVAPTLRDDALPTHQTHTHLSHHFGSALGAFTAGALISLGPDHRLTGLGTLLLVCVLAHGLALVLGLASVRVRSRPTSPAGVAA